MTPFQSLKKGEKKNRKRKTKKRATVSLKKKAAEKRSQKMEIAVNIPR